MDVRENDATCETRATNDERLWSVVICTCYWPPAGFQIVARISQRPYRLISSGVASAAHHIGVTGVGNNDVAVSEYRRQLRVEIRIGKE